MLTPGFWKPGFHLQSNDTVVESQCPFAQWRKASRWSDPKKNPQAWKLTISVSENGVYTPQMAIQLIHRDTHTLSFYIYIYIHRHACRYSMTAMINHWIWEFSPTFSGTMAHHGTKSCGTVALGRLCQRTLL